MTTLITPRLYDYYLQKNSGDLALSGKYSENPDFSDAVDLRTKRIQENGNYNAFPYSITIGSSIVGIFSEGLKHADSDKQVMFRSDDGGKTFSTVDFFINDTGAYNFSLISDLLNEGDTVVLKTWAIKKTGGVTSATSTPTVVNAGITYALWSEVVTVGSNSYRTGYAVEPAGELFNRVAIFSSPSSDQVNWSYLDEIANGGGSLKFNETSLTYTGSVSGFTVYIREDSGAGNPLYRCSGDNTGQNWSTPTLVPGITGRQPKVTPMANGKFVLTTGDRAGVIGESGNERTFYIDNTGINMYVSEVGDINTWGMPIQISTTYSTDGGQPWAVQISTNRILIPYYARRSIDKNPGIFTVSMDVTDLK